MKPDVKHLRLPPLADHWVAVDGDELARLLQMPGKAAFDDDMLQAIARVEEWHKQNISVWHHQEIHAIQTIAAGHLLLDDGRQLPIGQSFQRRLTKSDTHAVILLGYTVGPETDAYSKRLWDEEKFDESYLVKSYGAALAEELRSHYMLTLCDWAAQQDLSLLPPEGPGYNDWSTANMTDLYACLEEQGGATLKERIKLLPGGMLEPANSMLLAFGLTSYSGLEKIKRRELYPCSDCTYSPCSYRRTPFQPAGVP
jgi:hypothetical protein